MVKPPSSIMPGYMAKEATSLHKTSHNPKDIPCQDFSRNNPIEDEKAHVQEFFANFQQL